MFATQAQVFVQAAHSMLVLVVLVTVSLAIFWRIILRMFIAILAAGLIIAFATGMIMIAQVMHLVVK